MRTPLPLLLLSVALTAALHGEAHAQAAAAVSGEVGQPFLTCYRPNEHGGSAQSWQFVQDARGLLYVGNNNGVLEYDGASWRLIETANNVAWSLDLDARGRIYVGSSGDFGYLAPDAAGEMRYVSLLGEVPAEDRAFNDIRTTLVTPEGIYFQAWERLFRFTRAADGGWRVKVWRPEGRFLFAFRLGDAYYVHQEGLGLMRMAGDTLELLPGGEQFAAERLKVMLPYGKNSFLAGTFNRGLFLFNGRSFEPFATDAEAFLRANTLYDGARLADGTFALVTLEGGLVILSRKGTALHYIDETSGLPNLAILSIFVDRSTLLWVAMTNGICRAETPAPLSRFDATIAGIAYRIRRHRGTLYAGGDAGLVYLDHRSSRFRPVSGLLPGNNQVFWLLPFDDVLLLATGVGIYEVEGTRARLVRAGGPSFMPIVLHRSRQDSRRLFVGLADGLAVLRREPSGRWIDEGRLPAIHEYLTHIIEPEPGLLWLGTIAQGVLRVRLDPDPGRATPPLIDRFGREHGLPEGGVSVYDAGRAAVLRDAGRRVPLRRGQRAVRARPTARQRRRLRRDPGRVQRGRGPPG
ncbi:MAG: hypothetical protein GEU99_17475 [Luteitalea sp.]|nr:hypothetical protein [Luteitalea sp.]